MCSSDLYLVFLVGKSILEFVHLVPKLNAQDLLLVFQHMAGFDLHLVSRRRGAHRECSGMEDLLDGGIEVAGDGDR